LTFLVHVIGLATLVWALVSEDGIDLSGWWPHDEPDDDPSPPPSPPAPRGSVPLPDAGPSGVRLREPGRLAEGYPEPPRRPEPARVAGVAKAVDRRLQQRYGGCRAALLDEGEALVVELRGTGSGRRLRRLGPRRRRGRGTTRAGRAAGRAIARGECCDRGPGD